MTTVRSNIARSAQCGAVLVGLEVFVLGLNRTLPELQDAQTEYLARLAPGLQSCDKSEAQSLLGKAYP